MKKFLLLLLPIIFLSGCIKYGHGQATGYIYAVDDGILWDKVWYKSSLDSSESDCYLLNNDSIKQDLKTLEAGTRVTLNYDRHLATFSACPEGTRTEDEITSFAIAN